MSDENNSVVIVDATRSPLGSLQGELSHLSAPQISSQTLQYLFTKNSELKKYIQEVFIGCVLPAGIGQAPARQAALLGGISKSVPCSTINKMCGSGMQAVILAHDSIKAESNQCVLAGGMESMSNAPYLVPKARQGYRMGHGKLIDHMFFDGLEDAYEPGRLMGEFADITASEYGLSRKQQDDFALESLKRAQLAHKNNYFQAEICPIDDKILSDGLPARAKPEKIPHLKPAFTQDGTVTAANSSGIADGASSLVLMGEEFAQKNGFSPIAKIITHSKFAHDPNWFTTAPINAIENLLEKCQWSVDDVDLFEINEAFAVVTLVAMQALNIPHSKVNVHGGACALGHPIGATGARIITTLLYALKQNNLSRGIASQCIGGGEATAIAIEII